MSNNTDNTDNLRCGVVSLGQTGFRLQFGNLVIYVDPYLSNSVQELDDPRHSRLTPVAIPPSKVDDADWVFITHEHLDHCDPHTIVPLSEASPACRFVGPDRVRVILQDLGVASGRISVASERKMRIDDELSVTAVPAAHPTIERDPEGNLHYVGYVFEFGNRRLYHAGDTAVDDELIGALRDIGKIHVSFIPVNEQNYYRAEQGIVGNMSVRDAFRLTEQIGSDVLVPTHWDMFAENQVYREEIELLYRKIRPPFELAINPATV